MVSTALEIPDSVRQRKEEGPYFNEKKMGDPRQEYVCWIDVMGSQSIMRRSLRTAANFIMKLHVTTLEAQASFQDLELFPAIDGVYACTPTGVDMQRFIKNAMSKLALLFVHEQDPLKRFMVRAGMAFGPLAKGRSTLDCSETLRSHPKHCESILLGLPIAQAYGEERNASPYGVHIHDSARTFSPPTMRLAQTHWSWWRFESQEQDRDLAKTLKGALEAHYDWCRSHPTTILYPSQDIERHRALLDEYFLDT